MHARLDQTGSELRYEKESADLQDLEDYDENDNAPCEAGKNMTGQKLPDALCSVRNPRFAFLGLLVGGAL